MLPLSVHQNPFSQDAPLKPEIKERSGTDGEEAITLSIPVGWHSTAPWLGTRCGSGRGQQVKHGDRSPPPPARERTKEEQEYWGWGQHPTRSCWRQFGAKQWGDARGRSRTFHHWRHRTQGSKKQPGKPTLSPLPKLPTLPEPSSGTYPSHPGGISPPPASPGPPGILLMPLGVTLVVKHGSGFNRRYYGSVGAQPLRLPLLIAGA